MSRLTIAQLRKKLGMSPNNPPQVAAVTQTLAGERMTHTINFPTTGDTDCDLIQGVLAVINSLPSVSGDRLALVLRYLADRYAAVDKQTSATRNYELQNLVHRQQALEQHMIQMENRVTGQLGHYSMAGGLGGPLNPYTTSAGLTASQQIAASHASAMGMSPHQQMAQSDALDKLYEQIQNSKKP